MYISTTTYKGLTRTRWQADLLKRRWSIFSLARATGDTEQEAIASVKYKWLRKQSEKNDKKPKGRILEWNPEEGV